MKQSGKTRGHANPRKQSLRLPVLLSKHCSLSRSGLQVSNKPGHLNMPYDPIKRQKKV